MKNETERKLEIPTTDTGVFRYLSGQLNRRDTLKLLTGLDPDANRKIVGAIVHQVNLENKTKKLANKTDFETNESDLKS